MSSAYGRNDGGSAAQTVQWVGREVASTRKDAWRVKNGTRIRAGVEIDPGAMKLGVSAVGIGVAPITLPKRT